MSSWYQKYRGLTPKTRALIGIGLMGYAGLGLFLSDRAEEAYIKPTEQDKEELRKAIPRITLIDKDDVYGSNDKR